MVPKRPRPEPAPAGAPPLLAIVGPTASGKTALGLEVARALGGEIVSADSQQVYRHLEIGTAKPTAEERRAAPHHLVDAAEPTDSFSAGEFARLADAAIADISSRGRLPVVVGGTGLYVRALLFGIIEAPPADPAYRAELEAKAQREGKGAVHALLAALDPVTAHEIDPANLVRVIRALEIHRGSGQRPSELRAKHAFQRLRYRARVFGVQPPRPELYRRIDARAKAMFEAGLLDEVRELLAKGWRDAPALRALGYPQAIAVIEGKLSAEEAIARTALESRRYAKRQLTWFRAEPVVEWLAWPSSAAQVCALWNSVRTEPGLPGPG